MRHKRISNDRWIWSDMHNLIWSIWASTLPDQDNRCQEISRQYTYKHQKTKAIRNEWTADHHFTIKQSVWSLTSQTNHDQTNHRYICTGLCGQYEKYHHRNEYSRFGSHNISSLTLLWCSDHWGTSPQTPSSDTTSIPKAICSTILYHFKRGSTQHIKQNSIPRLWFGCISCKIRRKTKEFSFCLEVREVWDQYYMICRIIMLY